RPLTGSRTIVGSWKASKIEVFDPARTQAVELVSMGVQLDLQTQSSPPDTEYWDANHTEIRAIYDGLYSFTASVAGVGMMSESGKYGVIVAAPGDTIVIVHGGRHFGGHGNVGLRWCGSY